MKCSTNWFNKLFAEFLYPNKLVYSHDSSMQNKSTKLKPTKRDFRDKISDNETKRILRMHDTVKSAKFVVVKNGHGPIFFSK